MDRGFRECKRVAGEAKIIPLKNDLFEAPVLAGAFLFFGFLESLHILYVAPLGLLSPFFTIPRVETRGYRYVAPLGLLLIWILNHPG